MTHPSELLKEKIAVCKDFTPDERDLILDTLNLGHYIGKHEYPKNFKPGAEKWSTAAWAILDRIEPRAMTVANRFMLGGMIAGALQQFYEMGRKAK